MTGTEEMNSHYEAHGDEMPKVHKSGTNVGWGHGRYPNVALPLPPIPVLAEAVATCFLTTILAIPARKQVSNHPAAVLVTAL